MRRPHAYKKLLPSETLTNEFRAPQQSVTCPFRIYPPSDDLHQWWQNSEYSAAALASIMTVRDPTPIIGFLCSVLPRNKAEALQRRTRVCRIVNRLIGALVFVPYEEEQCIPSAAAVDLVYDSQRKCIFLIGSILVPEILKREPLEDLKMHLLMYTCCNALFHVQDSQRFDIAMLRQFEALAESKKLLANALQQNSMKRSKRDKHSGKHAKGSQNTFAPGYCVPFSVFVLPGSKDQLRASPSFASSYCRKMDNVLFNASKVLCPGVIGSSRIKEISAASMEVGLFYLDPAYSVALVSSDLTTGKGDVEHHCDKVFNALDEDLIDGSEDSVSVESLLQLFTEDDSGIVHLSHTIDRFVVSLHGNRDIPRRFHAKDKTDGNYSELLAPKQWLAMYQHLYSAIDQITEKKNMLISNHTRDHVSCSSVSSSPLSQ